MNDLRMPPATRSLSARLLVLAIAYVMISEVLIFAPSIARFRVTYLQDRLETARLAVVALDTDPGAEISDAIAEALLQQVDAHTIVLREHAERKLMLVRDPVPMPIDYYDLDHLGFFERIGQAFMALLHTTPRQIRVMGAVPSDPNTMVEIVIDEAPMRSEMLGFSARVAGLSILISLLTASLIYVTLHVTMVRPMQRLTRSMMAFRDRPEDDSRIIVPENRSDEIGVAQRVLADMQQNLRAALVQKERLAALGAAVSKINHDLRNALSTAHLLSEAVGRSQDPQVQQTAPRLIGAIDRAADMCALMLEFAREGPLPLHREAFALADLVEEVRYSLPPDARDRVALDNQVPADFQVRADRDQLFRVLNNLCRNSVEAGARHLDISAQQDTDHKFIDVADDGPGLPEAVRDKLFQPFAGSARPGGTGLGLAIARDIMRAHGGDILPLATGAAGTTFRLELPARDGAAA